jgi:hypothetical protein
MHPHLTHLAKWSKGWSHEDWIEYSNAIQDLAQGRPLKYDEFVKKHPSDKDSAKEE